LSRPSLSIVIPTYNGRHLLAICLPSVFLHLPEKLDAEVIVSDDGSTDGTCEWLREAYPQVRVVRQERNAGFVAAANAGIHAARGTIVQLLNNDTEVTAGWIEAALPLFEDATVGSVAPLVLVRSQRHRVDSAGDGYSLFGWPSKIGHGQDASRWEGRRAADVFGASGSSAFYRAEALRKVGAYDPAFGSYYEDVDLAFRLRWGGYRCVFAPQSRILHEVSASYRHDRPDLQRRMSRNAEILFWTNLPTRVLALAIVPHLAFVLAQAGWRLLRGRLRPFAAGKLDALRAVKTLRSGRAQRRKLSADAIARPHFPLTVTALSDLANHWTRPREASGKLDCRGDGPSVS
jgi:GT2 family glycosyltransferase